MLCGVFKNCLALRPDCCIGAEENVTDSILTWLREFEVLFMLEFLPHEHMGDRSHDTSTITVATVGSDGTAVRHVTQQIAG
jgi:hypothetical protein